MCNFPLHSLLHTLLNNYAKYFDWACAPNIQKSPGKFIMEIYTRYFLCTYFRPLQWHLNNSCGFKASIIALKFIDVFFFFEWLQSDYSKIALHPPDHYYSAYTPLPVRDNRLCIPILRREGRMALKLKHLLWRHFCAGTTGTIN